jgi:putative ABC transport system permease protein
MSWISRIANVFRRQRIASDLDEELRFHIAERAEEFVREGMPRGEAELRARRQLGNTLLLRESSYEAKAAGWLDDTLRDFQFGLRMLRKNRGFALMGTIILALGIGSTTAMFGMINAMLLRQLPYPNAERLVSLYEPNPHIPGVPLGAFGPIVGDFFDWKKESRSFSSLALFTTDRMNVAVDNSAVRVKGSRVTGDFFQVLGVSAEIGRGVEPGDDDPEKPEVAVISHALWRSRFGADPDVLGKKLLLNARTYQVIGIMPAGFAFPSVDEWFDMNGEGTDVWVPWMMTPEEKASRNPGSEVFGIGLLRPGLPLSQAQAEMSTIAARLDPLHSEFRDWGAVVEPINASLIKMARAPMLIFMGAVVLVLLIACSNVAGLILARTNSRAHEMNVRTALGAPRMRLIRQLLVESLCLAAAGGSLGLLAAVNAMRVISRLEPEIPRLSQASIDGRVLLVAAGVTLATALLCGLFPALSASRCDLNQVLKGPGSRSIKEGVGRLHRGLMVAEVAISFVLLVSSGLLMRSFIRVQSVDKGFVANSMIAAHLQLDPRYDTTGRQTEFFRTLLERANALPGVTAAAAIDHRPFGGGEIFSFLEVEGYPFDEKQSFESRSVTPGYFEAMRIPLLEGRGFTDGDTPPRPPAFLVSRSFAEKYFPGQSAVGKRFRYSNGSAHSDWFTINGVVGDVHYMRLAANPPPQLYRCLWQDGADAAYLLARTSLPADRVGSDLQKLVRDIDPAVAVADVHTMSELASDAAMLQGIPTAIMGGFGCVGLLLSLVGLYGLMTYFVQQRTAEIGIRMAMGAQRRSVMLMVLQQGAKLAFSGIVIGLICAWGATRFLEDLLFEIKATDAPTFLVVAALFGGVSMLACYLPARRATRIDPMTALRYE